MCLDMVQTRAGGQEGLKLRSGSFSRSARQAAEPTDSTPNVVTCHVTVISWLDRERHAPFLIRHPGKSHVDFLILRFLNAREHVDGNIATRGHLVATAATGTPRLSS